VARLPLNIPRAQAQLAIFSLRINMNSSSAAPD